MLFTLKKKKNLNLELLENIACKDEILLEYKKIRHEYNNLLHNILCLIEVEDLEGLKDYKYKLIEKAEILNRNNLTQLVKIKNITLLNLIYKIITKGKNSGISINLTIYNDIETLDFSKMKLYKLLEEYLNFAFEMAIKTGSEFNLKINSTTEGVQFVFENSYHINQYQYISELIKEKKKPKTKNIFFNSFVDSTQLKQEIIIIKSL